MELMSTSAILGFSIFGPREKKFKFSWCPILRDRKGAGKAGDVFYGKISSRA